MADDNRPLKYARYAIGEIILVVIGILIALQINNWNEERKERIEEKNLLLELRTEFREKKESLEAYGRERDSDINSINIYYALAISKTLEYDPDSLRFLVNGLTRMAGIVTANRTLNSIENSGKINLIKNDELRNYFKIWENSLIGLNRFAQEKEVLRSRDISPMISEYFLIKEGYYSDGSQGVEIIDATSIDKGIKNFFNAPSKRNLINTYSNMLKASFYTSG